jgi:5-methylcytosine-specific restriction endonuclease McrA
MGYNDEELKIIYYKTEGYCNICGKKLSLINYGNLDGKGSWEVDHSKPVARGGTNHLNNLRPVCISCNRKKGTDTTPSARRKFGQ